MIDLVLDIDRLAATCCIVLGENPTTAFSKVCSSLRLYGENLAAENVSPRPLLTLHNQPQANDYTRRATAAQRAKPNGAGQLQRNIDRLFAQRVVVFGSGGEGNPPLALVLGTVIKATLKAALEVARTRSFWGSGAVQIATDLSFFKKCATGLLGGSGSATGGSAQHQQGQQQHSSSQPSTKQDVDTIHEQLLITLGARSDRAAAESPDALQEAISAFCDKAITV
jgi:hypothetical protein